MEAELVKAFPQHKGDPEKAVEAWFAELVPDATFMGVPIRASKGSAAPGVHRRLHEALRRAEQMLIAKGMKMAGETDRDDDDESAEGDDVDTELAAFTVRDISGLRPPQPATGKNAGVSRHCYGLAVDINPSTNPFVRYSGARIIERATTLISGKKYTLDAKKKKGQTTEDAYDELRRGSDDLEKYYALGEKGPEAIKRQLEKNPAAAALGDAAWWVEQIKLDRTNKKRTSNWVGSKPTQGYMDLPKAFVTALVDAGLTWGGSYGGGKDLMHFDLKHF